MSEFYAEIPRYTMEDIILPKHVKDRILDMLEYAKNSEKVCHEWGLEKTHRHSKRMGINLYGPSGTGKTMTAHAIANALGRNILIVSYADIESKFVGDTPKNIRRVFEAARDSQSILFFDEADAILSKRVTNMSNATDVSVNQTRSVMLMLLNEFDDFIIFATNFIENFDAAFMRWISTHIKFELPDYEGRIQLWKLYIPKELPTDLDVEDIAQQYDGVMGSDISMAVLHAAFKAARLEDAVVKKDYFYQAIEDILHSKEENERRHIEGR